MAAASRLLQRALGLIEEERPERRELLVKLSIALAGTGEVSRAGALLSDQIETHLAGRTHLAYRDADGHAHTVDLESAERPVRIGRRGVNEIGLGWDSEVSRQHAELHAAEDGSWRIHDLGSQNGTFVNGERLEDSRTLDDGDMIRVGRTILAFRHPREGSAKGADESAVTVLRGQGLGPL